MSTSSSCFTFFRRSLGLAAVAGMGFGTASAQSLSQAAAPSQAAVPAAQSASPFLLPMSPQTFSLKPASLAANEDAPGFSSSASSSYDPAQAAQTQLASLEKGLSLPGANAMQYGQRRRYGAPRYRGGNTNADGSEKYSAYVGGGFEIPAGSNSDYLKTSWGLQVGAGRNLNKNFGVNLEFDYDHFGMTGQTIANQSYRYFGDATNPYGLDANSHIWSFSVQPTYQIYSGPGLGVFLTAGVGFYHKVANFTLPETEEESDGFAIYEFQANENVDHYTSNAPGFDGGVGLTYKFSRFSNERLYAEARYVYVDNKFRSGDTNDTAATYSGNNFFPENSNTTSYLPIKFGIRF